MQFFYDETGSLQKCVINGCDDEPVRIPQINRELITGKKMQEKKKTLRKTDMTKALKNIVKSWQEEEIGNIYAISIFVNHEGSEITDFTVSYNIERNQIGEERWNYAFWEQDEEDLMYIFDDCAIGYIRLLEMLSQITAKLQSERYFEKIFGRSIAVIIHGYEYGEDEIKATKLANPNGEAEEFFCIMENK